MKGQVTMSAGKLTLGTIVFGVSVIMVILAVQDLGIMARLTADQWNSGFVLIGALILFLETAMEDKFNFKSPSQAIAMVIAVIATLIGLSGFAVLSLPAIIVSIRGFVLLLLAGLVAFELFRIKV